MEIASPNVLIWTVLVFGGYVLSVCLHEFGHAMVAYWGGDISVKDKGYLTLNPLKYTHPAYSLWMPLIFLLLGGIPLPGAAVYINRNRLRGPAWNSAVSAAGPLMTGLVAVAIALYLKLIQPDYAATNIALLGLLQDIDTAVVTRQDWLNQGLALLLTLEVAGVFLNLIPLPGLDGYGIIEPWLPTNLQKTAQKYSQYSILALFAAFWIIPSFNQGFWGLINRVVTLLGVPSNVARLGFVLFRQGATTVFVVLIVGLVIFKQWQKRYGTPPQVSKAELNRQLEILDQRLYEDPQDAEALVAKAYILVQLNQGEQALTYLDKALTYPSDQATQTTALRLQSVIYFDQERYDDCLTVLDQHLELDPQNADAAYNKACCYAKLGDIAAGKTWLAKAIDQNPDFQQQAQTDEDLAPLRDAP